MKMVNISVSNKIENFFSQYKIIRYKNGETILRADDIPSGAYYVKSGHVRMNSILHDGRILTVNIFKPGSYFPMLWIISNLENSYFFQAMTDVEIRRVTKEMMINFIKNNPDVLFELTHRILIGLNSLITNIEYLFSGNAQSRVASALLLLARRFGEKKDKNEMIIKLFLTHQDIANCAAITRETASIEIKKLERKGIINIQNRLLVVNLGKLEKEIEIKEEPQSNLAL